MSAQKAPKDAIACSDKLERTGSVRQTWVQLLAVYEKQITFIFMGIFSAESEDRQESGLKERGRIGPQVRIEPGFLFYICIAYVARAQVGSMGQ